MEDKLENLAIARRRMVRLMSNVGHGRIENFQVIKGDPVLRSESRITYELQLDRPTEAAKRSSSAFVLKAPVKTLFSHLTRLGDCEVAFVEVRNGMPTKISIHAPAVHDLDGGV